ncbi:uncharacterized protein LOC127257591 [Andrographis paniculata]|uniref:uncharacterized protein LOC127257591 n=1 Tax=Andrographis paniculata TaxID=175694 RepID=UPI0021E7EE35|nr:uncharacterized protein LOC127257591 [Andrographis paniculata]
MGIGGIIGGSGGDGECSHPRTRKVFILTNYALLGAASSCIFLTLSLRLVPSLVGFFFILLQLITIAGAIAGSAAASRGGSSKYYYGAHMVATVLTAIFQGSVSVLILTRPSDFLEHLKSYVMQENGVAILKLAGGLCVAIFCLEWVVLTLAFFLNYYAYVERNNGSSSYGVKGGSSTAKVQDAHGLPQPFQIV